jgi:uncharacterized membrane protein HdeD (DUF308 family)
MDEARPPMQSIARMSRSVWWAFAAAGVIAFAAAAVAALQLAPAPIVTGVWQLASGIVLLVAARRVPGGFRQAIPILGAAVAGVLLGVAVALLPTDDPRVSLSIIGIWVLVTGAGYLAIANIVRALRIPDGGLYAIAWVAIGIGIVVSTVPAFGFGNAALVPAVALALAGAVTIAAATRMRILPDEAPPVLSNREERRRERAEPRR